jgi:hypothetical protein
MDPPSSVLADLAPKTAGPRATRAIGVVNSAFRPVNLARSEAFFLAEVVKNFEGVGVDNLEVDPLRRAVDKRETARDMAKSL